MSRAARLLDLLQALRGRRTPVPARELAGSLGVSLRTIYRDIATLAAQGAAIEGEAGIGYVLRPGFFLPPLRFDDDETDALILGLRLAGERGDPALGQAAARALAKITAVLPEPGGREVALLVPPRAGSPHLLAIRRAIRDERKLHLQYVDRQGRASERTVWPVAVGFFEAAEVLAAWCEERTGFRHFRLDRIARADLLPDRFPTRHRLLLAEWRMTIADGN